MIFVNMEITIVLQLVPASSVLKSQGLVSTKIDSNFYVGITAIKSRHCYERNIMVMRMECHYQITLPFGLEGIIIHCQNIFV